MKKFLSLVLALIMTMSLVTVSASAKDFTDDDKLNYEEAVAVMSEIGVIDGYTDGSFKPQNGLTRGAAAKIICNMILGPTTASALRADTAPFKDVAVDNQYAGYIAYCVQQGITSGYTDGTYRPAAPLTNFAFMKMLLGALGYDAVAEGYVGGNCFINVAKQAIGIGLNKSLLEEFDGGKQITREEAALFAFNTLKATMVEYDAKTVVSAGGVEVTLSGNLKDVSWTGYNNADGNVKDDGKVQFAEKYFPKLVGDPTVDAFGRPATTWAYNKKDVGTYVNNDLLVATYTTDVEGGEVWSDIGSVAAKFDLTFYVDGDELTAAQTKAEAAQLVKKNDDSVGENATDAVVGNGVLTEVYADVDAEELTIVQVHTWLAEAVADYNTKTETLTLEIFNGATTNKATPETLSITKKISVDDVPGIEDYEEKDMVLVTIASGDVQTVTPVETVEEVSISAYSTGYKTNAAEQENKLTKLTADGEKYETTATAYEDAAILWDYNVAQLKDATYDLYVDAYGYVIGIRKVSADDQYVFVVGYEKNSSYLASSIDDALVIFTDGTMETVKAKMDSKISDADKTALLTATEVQGAKVYGDGNSNVDSWFTYTVNDSGVYTLKAQVEKQIKDTGAHVIDKTYTTVEGGGKVAYGNADSTYISVKIDKDVTAAGSIVKVENVTTGIKKTSIKVTNSDTFTNYDADNAKIFAMYNSNGYVTAAVVVGKSAGVSENIVFLTSGIKSKELVDGEYIYTYKAILKGEETTIQSFEAEALVPGAAAQKLAAGNLYMATFDSDGIITELEKLAQTNPMKTATYKDAGYALKVVADNATTTVGNDTVAGKELTLKGLTLWIDDEAANEQYILLDEDCKIFVKASDDSNYELYTTATSALNAIGKDTFFTGTIAAVCDESGIATTLVLLDTNKANDEKATQPVQPDNTGAVIKDVTSADLEGTAFEGATSYIAKGLKGEMVDGVLVVTGTIGKGYEFTSASTTDVPGFGVMGNYLTGASSNKCAIIPITLNGEICLWLIGDATETFTVTNSAGNTASVNVKNVIWA